MNEIEIIKAEIERRILDWRMGMSSEAKYRLEAYTELLEVVNTLPKEPVRHRFAFKALPRLLEMLEPTERAKTYCQRLISELEKEGYTTDVKIVNECLRQMNGEKVSMATMDEQKSAWSEEDEKQARQIERIVHYDGCTQKLQKQIADWLKSLKDRVQPQPKQEWSEEQIKEIFTEVRLYEFVRNCVSYDGEVDDKAELRRYFLDKFGEDIERIAKN